MRRIGFGVIQKNVKGQSYLYVWHYENGKRKEKCVGRDKGRALSELRHLAREARGDAVSYIKEQVVRYERMLS